MKAPNGWIYGSKEHGPSLWIKGKTVINGEWDVTYSEDRLTCWWHERPEHVQHRLFPAPAGRDYNAVLHDAQAIFDKAAK
jgi:hypothetical protein